MKVKLKKVQKSEIAQLMAQYLIKHFKQKILAGSLIQLVMRDPTLALEDEMTMSKLLEFLYFSD